MKNTKKMLPLVVLVIVMAVLVMLLAVLQRGDDTTDARSPRGVPRFHCRE